jgi:preprotein translocase subunit SecD
MSRSLLWKLALIVAVVAGAVFLVHPIDEKIALGLDLQGGSHIVMQADTDSALKYETDQRVNRISYVLDDRGLTYQAVLAADATTLEIRGADPARRADVREVLDNLVPGWDVLDKGSGNWQVSMPLVRRQEVASTAVDTTLDNIRNRIDQFGVREPTVQKQGMSGDRILIQLPGVEDPQRAKDLLTSQAILEWKAVTYPAGVTNYANWGPPTSRESTLGLFGGRLPADTDLYVERNIGPDGESLDFWWPLKRVSVVAGPDLVNAYRIQDEWGEPAVSFELSQEAGRRFQAATRENLRRRMAIVLDNRVISAPVIESVIADQGRITGSFTIEGAEDLALKLRSGAIPIDVDIIEERTVGPSLGLDSIKAGVYAGVGSFIGVLLFMVAYYRLSGINAVVALGLNILLVLAAMAYMGATMTLPGIAGLILTVGMAVDSNVLIFERIREELRLGKTVRSAVDQGFGRAFMTILDCNVTTLVAAFFLFSYGTGPVKGFAVTLTFGLLASMFTAVFVSRQIFELVLGRGRAVESLSI